MRKDLVKLSKRGRELNLAFPFGTITPGTVFTHARRGETRKHLIDALARTQLDDVDHWRRELMARGLAEYGESWDYLDNVCVAHSFSMLAQPRQVLEIGVRRGMCTCAMGAAAVDAELYLVDLWVENYGGQPNPGPSAIAPDLAAAGHRGKTEFFSGSSHDVVPKLLEERPGLMFDLIVVDGDHSPEGAWEDLKLVMPRLELGGMLVFDDIALPGDQALYQVWRNCLEQVGVRGRWAEYLDHGHGVGILIRAY